MNKKILAFTLIVLLLVGIVVLAIVLRPSNGSNADNISASDSAEETTVPAEYRMEYTDRLCGSPETDCQTADKTVTITYGDKGTVKRVFESDELMSSEQEYSQTKTQEINGNKITLKGKNDKIYTAAWIENHNSYLIELNPEYGGVEADEMAAYIDATR